MQLSELDERRIVFFLTQTYGYTLEREYLCHEQIS